MTQDNLRRSRQFEDAFVARLAERLEGQDTQERTYGFVGNLANNMMIRAQALREQAYHIDVVLHPQDDFVMSDPGWELADVRLPDGVRSISGLAEHGIMLPDPPNVVRTASSSTDVDDIWLPAMRSASWQWPTAHPASSFARQVDVLRFASYFNYLPTLEALQKYDALFAAQAPYLAYLSGRPYLSAQTGGDLFFEASRDDTFGKLQRLSYKMSKALLATNPWAYSAARRFGFNHVVYAPLLIDTDAYSPGDRTYREQWERDTGGSFFVLATARLDRRWKRSEIGFEGFKRFAAKTPEARLLLVGWGQDVDELLAEFKKDGLHDRVHVLPVSGKRTLVNYLRSCDCVLDQFRIGYYGATALEAMACGVPVVMKLQTDQYDAMCKTGAPPVLNASCPEDVTAALSKLCASPEHLVAVSARGVRWIKENHSAYAWGETYGVLLAAAAAGLEFDFSEAPLNERLGLREMLYHYRQLRNAPKFPNYV